MRRWKGLALALSALFVCLSISAPVDASRRPNDKPPPKNKWQHKEVGSGGFRFNRGRPSREVTAKKVQNCQSWTVTVDQPGPDDEDGNPTVVKVTQRWRYCEGYRVGALCIPPGLNVQKWCFRLADDAVEEVSEVFAPKPVITFDSRTPAPLAYAQRQMYWWLDPATQSTVVAPVEIVEGGRSTGRQIGSATLRPVKLIFDPGIAGSGAQECDGADVTRAYDDEVAHTEQPTNCWHVYYVSSRKEPGQRYQAFARVEWEVLNVTINGVAQDGPFENRESVSDFIPVEVREIQAIPTCRGSNPEECPFK
jgi:hypothetical protein